MFTREELEVMKGIEAKSLNGLRGVDLTLPVGERLGLIERAGVNPYRYVSAGGLKVKIGHKGERTLDDALFEHFKQY